MKKSLYLILCVAITVSACQMLKRLDMFSLEIGMTKAQAIQALQKKPDNIVGAKHYDDGVLEVVQFSGPAMTAVSEDQIERYWLYFFNDRLMEWGQPLDWQLETERIYRMRKKILGRH